MNKTQKFLIADPDAKADMLLRGYDHLTLRIETINIELKILNAWLRIVPTLIVENGCTPPGDDLKSSVLHYSRQMNAMSNLFVENADLLKEMDDAITFFNKLSNENK